MDDKGTRSTVSLNLHLQERSQVSVVDHGRCLIVDVKGCHVTVNDIDVAAILEALAKEATARARAERQRDALLEALKALRDDVQRCHVGMDRRAPNCCVCQSLDMADAAIATVKGGA